MHVVLNLVGGDGRIANTYRDWPRWRAWCLDVERRLELTATSPANKTAPIRPTRAEVEKATRLGRPELSRDFLRGVVRTAATRASSAQEFVALIRQDRVPIETRWGQDGQLVGYKVAAFGDRARVPHDGQVWFSGSHLARDLSAPKLMARWASAPAPVPPPLQPEGERASARQAERLAAVQDATDAAARARDALAGMARAVRDDDADTKEQIELAEGIAHATLDVVVAATNVVDGSRKSTPLMAAALAYERAALMPYRVQPSRWAPVAVELRTAARRLSRINMATRRGNVGVAVVALLVSLAALVAEIAAWHELRRQRAQAIAARLTVDYLVKAEAMYGP